MKAVKFENLKLHIIAWSVFVAYELLFVFSLNGKLGNFWDYLGHYSLNLGLFYFNAIVVLPNTLGRGKTLFYFMLIPWILLELVVYTLLKYLLLDFYHIFNIEVIPPFINDNNYIVQGIWRAIYFLGLSTGYWFAVSTIQNRKKIADMEKTQLRNELENQALEKALLTTENAYLKSQINPHFLLNTLNFLYNSVSKFSDKIADSVMTLADIMRYALTNADEDGKVRLELELEHISNFISLNQARFSQKLCIDMAVEGDADGLRIIPLVLITLVENIFKYGDLQNERQPARIFARIDGSQLTFVTQNLKKKKVTEPGYGIGVQNIKNRLSAYHEYDLTIEDNETDYKSTLIIQL